jgi:hypothetical protein
MLRCNKTPQALFVAAWSESYQSLKQTRHVARRAACSSLRLSDQSFTDQSGQNGTGALTPP